jgi:CheY-like chemotaxis protein
VLPNLDVAKSLLVPYGITTHCATSGEEAIGLIRDEEIKYDLVFMDQMMPRMDGIEAVHIIRNDIGTEYAENVPIIALTANAIVGIEEMFINNGFQGFVSKPIDIKQLDKILNHFIRDRQSNETLIQAELEFQRLKKHRKDGESLQDNLTVLQTKHVPGLNIIEGLSRCDNQTSIYLSLLESWAKHTSKILEDLDINSKINFKNYGIKVHGIKGSSYGICAHKVGEIASELEKAAGRADYDFIHDTHPAFVITCSALIADIHTLLSEYQGASKYFTKEKKPSPDPKILKNILANCALFKTGLIKKDIKHLEQFSYESDGDLVDHLRDHLENLEYDMIKDILTKYLNENSHADSQESSLESMP